MENNMNHCCCSENQIENKSYKKGNCPACGKEGNLVKNYTVKHIVVEELTEEVGSSNYYLCMNEDCDVVYYSSDSSTIFNKQQVKVPIWFKKDANPKYACYCSQVTEEQVIKAVIEKGAKSMAEVLEITGAMKNPQCREKNPLGKCCHQIIQNAIEKAFKIKSGS